MYAPVSGEDFNRDSVGYPASKAGNVYPPPFYMQGQWITTRFEIERLDSTMTL